MLHVLASGSRQCGGPCLRARVPGVWASGALLACPVVGGEVCACFLLALLYGLVCVYVSECVRVCVCVCVCV